MQGLTFNSMRSEGRHFCIRKIDENQTTNDYGIMGNFDTSTDELRYYGIIKRILKVNFIYFHTYLFKCRWFTSVVKRHENGLYMVDCTQFHKGRTDNLIHPTSCEQVSTKQGL